MRTELENKARKLVRKIVKSNGGKQVKLRAELAKLIAHMKAVKEGKFIIDKSQNG